MPLRRRSKACNGAWKAETRCRSLSGTIAALMKGVLSTFAVFGGTKVWLALWINNRKTGFEARFLSQPIFYNKQSYPLLEQGGNSPPLRGGQRGGEWVMVGLHCK